MAGSRGRRFLVTLLCAALLAVEGAGPASTQPGGVKRDPVRIMPEPALQQLLDRLPRASGSPDFYRRVADIFEHAESVGARAEGEAFIHQVLFYAAYGPEPHVERLEAMGMLLRTELMRTIRVSQDEVVWSVAPYLSEEDGRMRRAADLLLKYVDVYRPDYQNDEGFDAIEGYLRGPPPLENPPAQLIRGMFDARPYAAVRSLASIYLAKNNTGDAQDNRIAMEKVMKVMEPVGRIQRFLPARNGQMPAPMPHEIASDVQAVARSEYWWIRLYAADLMKRFPALRDPDVMRRLSNDPNGIVREIVADALRSRAMKWQEMAEDSGTGPIKQ
jgi:hypothetical protein